MEYPRTPYDKKKSVKLKTHDIEAIHWLFHVEKWTIPQIADRFKVVPDTIRYHLDTQYREKRIQLTSERIMKRYNIDKNFKKRTRETYKKNKALQIKMCPELRLYNSYISSKWYKKHKERVISYTLEWRKSHRESYLKYQREYRNRNKI